MSHDFDPTTGEFNSGRLGKPGDTPAPRRRAAAPPAPPAYQPPYREHASSAPRAPTTSSDNGLGVAILIAAALTMVLFVGQPRAPRATLPANHEAARARSEATQPRNTALEVLPPLTPVSSGLSRDGDRITVDASTVLLDAPWVIDRPMVIRGRGSATSTIIYDGAGTLLTFAGEGTLRIEGVTLARRSTTAGNFVTAESGVIELVDVRLTGGVAGPGYSGSGLVADAAARATIDRSTVDGNAVGMRLLQTASAHVVNSDLRDNEAIGIVLTGRSDAVIRDSRIESNGAEGIVVGDDSRASITGNSIADNGARGVSFLGRATGSATSNEIASNGYGDAQQTDYWQGVAVQDTAHVTLHGNTIRGNAGVGIQFLHAAGGSVRDNTVTGNSANHVAYLLGSGRPAVSAGGLVLGMLGQSHNPRPDVGHNRFVGNNGGDLVDHRPGTNATGATAPAAHGRVTPTPTPAPVYVLASTVDGRGDLRTDGHLNVYVADVPIHRDTRPPNGPAIAPIILHVERGDSLWVELINPRGDDCRWSDVFLVDPSGRGHLVLAGSVLLRGCQRGVVALVEFVVP